MFPNHPLVRVEWLPNFARKPKLIPSGLNYFILGRRLKKTSAFICWSSSFAYCSIRIFEVALNRKLDLIADNTGRGYSSLSDHEALASYFLFSIAHAPGRYEFDSRIPAIFLFFSFFFFWFIVTLRYIASCEPIRYDRHLCARFAM
jgi:hypothetical protein